MQTKLGEARVDVVANLKQLETGFALAEGLALKAAGAIGLAFSVAGAASFIKSSVQAYMKQESALKQVQSAATKLGLNWRYLRGEVESVTAALQRKTTYGDEESTAALAMLIRLSKDYTRSMQALPVVLDVAAATGRDLGSVAEAVGRAFGGNTRVLAQLVPGFSKLEESAKGNVDVIQLLSGAYKGAAEDMADTTTGRIKQMTDAWVDLKEKIGAVMAYATPLLKTFTEILHRMVDKSITYEPIISQIKMMDDEINKLQMTIKSGMQFVSAGGKTQLLPVALTPEDLENNKKAADSIAGLRKQLDLLKSQVPPEILKKALEVPDSVVKRVSLTKEQIEKLEKIRRELAARRLDIEIRESEREWNAEIERIKKLKELAEIELKNKADTDAREYEQFWANLLRQDELEKQAIAKRQGRMEFFANQVASIFGSDWVRDSRKNIGQLTEYFLRSMATMMAQAAVFAAIMSLVMPGGGGFGAYFMKSIFGSGKGNIFSGGDIQRFGSGGIVDRPTLFPMRRGLGLMGEAGAEAIMPLTRLSDGSLGVRAELAGRGLNMTPQFSISIDGQALAAIVRKNNSTYARRGI